ncbi:MAG TPA: hypothetical protein VLB29_01630 [Nocardioidaceae bacterium]|nr:hypothetical protein [Nocardioidaceae bacterium]
MSYLKLTAAIAAGVFLSLVAFDLYQRVDLSDGLTLLLWGGLLVGVPIWALAVGHRASEDAER